MRGRHLAAASGRPSSSSPPAGVQRYDGVRLRAGGNATRAYHDPLLRISGRTAMIVRVVGRRR